MKHQLTAVYAPPDDPAQFDSYYDDVHIPLVKTLPGLRGFSVQRPAANSDDSSPAYHLIAVLTFDDEAALSTALTSPEGQVTVADVQNFAHAGATIVTGPVITVL